MTERERRAAIAAAMYGGGGDPPWMRPERDAYGGSTLGDLIGRQGQIQAQRHLQSGQTLADSIREVGNMAGAYFKDRDDKREMAKRDAATMAAIEAWDGQDPTQLYAGLQKIRPQDALQYTNAVLSLRKGPQKDPNQELERLGKMAQFLGDQDDAVIARAWPHIRESFGSTAERLGLPLTEQWDPQARPLLGKIGETFGPKRESKLVPVPAGGLYDPEKGEIVAKPAEKKDPGHKVTVAGPGGVPMAKLVTDEELAAGVQEYREPKAPREPKAVDRQWVLRDGQAVRVTEGEIKPGDQPYAARNTTEKDTGTVGKVLEDIDRLSKKINTGSGPLARAAGVFRGKTAGLNLDPDVQELDSLVSGFTPIVARAVGHTGVLTEQDVESVRKLFPGPGDSTELRDRKMAQLRRLMAGSEGGGGAQGGSPAPASGPPRVQNAADYSKLPSGAVYIDPSGKTRRKP